ncbi:MAG: VOC family protein [Chloroflexota bacterium]
MSDLNWFEIPVTDMDRAQKFYSILLDADIPVMDMREAMGSLLGMLPNRDGVGGALVENRQHGYVPSQEGTLVYLAFGEVDLEVPLSKVEAAGGQIVLPKTTLGEIGFTAWFIDTEGNKVGLHSMV